VVTLSLFDEVDTEFTITELSVHDGVLWLWHQAGEHMPREHVASYPLTTVHHWVSRPKYP
jgi:hypothetical protein